MSLQQLRYLLALDDHRHFSEAARHCFVAQPTLTTQVKKLEEELGVQLIDRKATPLEPTAIGRKVIAQAQLILQDVAGLHALLEVETNDLSGHYVLGIIPTLAPYLLPLFIRTLTEQLPEVTLVVQELQSEAIIEGLQRGSVDLGLLVTPLNEPQLREIPLFHEPFLIYAAPETDILQQNPLLPDHVVRKDLWILEQGHCFRNQVLNICSADGSSSPSGSVNFQAGSVETLKNMVRHGSGYTIIPEMSVRPEEDSPYVKRFADPQPAREVSLVVSRAFARERLLSELRQVALSVVPETFRKEERFVGVSWR